MLFHNSLKRFRNFNMTIAQIFIICYNVIMINLVALCSIGAEKILSNEIKLLGYKPLSNSPGRVRFESDESGMFRSNLCLRTADRIYLQLSSFFAEDFDALFDGVYAISWQDYFKKDVKIHVDKVRTFRSKLSSEHSVQTITHKAICKKLGFVWGMEVLPETGNKSDVRIYIEKNEVSVLLDLSGKPLNRRGYRMDGGIAPIRETLAATLLQIMCWRRKTPLHDAFCGSGTIISEAMLYAHNVAPGFGRRFDLENLPIFNSIQADEIKKKEAEKIRTDVVCRITGTDIDFSAVERARENIERACVTAGRALQLIGSDNRIPRPEIDIADFRELSAPYETGLILSNPPYGERIGTEEEINMLYKDMSDLIKSFPGWQMGFITADLDFESKFGKKAESKKNLKSGILDTALFVYENKV